MVVIEIKKRYRRFGSIKVCVEIAYTMDNRNNSYKTK
jgi:hypothetical protein